MEATVLKSVYSIENAHKQKYRYEHDGENFSKAYKDESIWEPGRYWLARWKQGSYWLGRWKQDPLFAARPSFASVLEFLQPENFTKVKGTL